MPSLLAAPLSHLNLVLTLKAYTPQIDCSSPDTHPRAEGSGATQLAEIYAKLEEIEADKAPARYANTPSTPVSPPPSCLL